MLNYKLKYVWVEYLINIHLKIYKLKKIIKYGYPKLLMPIKDQGIFVIVEKYHKMMLHLVNGKKMDVIM